MQEHKHSAPIDLVEDNDPSHTQAIAKHVNAIQDEPATLTQ